MSSTDGLDSPSTSSASCTEHHRLLNGLELLSILDPWLSEEDWCRRHSLETLRLTLGDIIADCNKQPLDEFPYLPQRSVSTGSSKVIPCAPRPQAHLDSAKLTFRESQLKVLIRCCEDRIRWLSTGSRLYFGLVKGSRVAFLLESSDQLWREGEGLEEHRSAARLLFSEQLGEKEAVYLVQFGSHASPTVPDPLPFTNDKKRCSRLAFDWLSTLTGSGSCNLLEALKVALQLKNVDTICVLLSSSPDQNPAVVTDFMVDSLTGCDTPRLHLVAFNSSEKTASFLSQLSRDTGGTFHCYTSPNQAESSAVEDTDINKIREEVNRAKSVLSSLEDMRSGVLTESVVHTLRELSVSSDWRAATPLSPSSPPEIEHHLCSPCSSEEWLQQHGLAASGLDLYDHLAPNAYPQLEGFVDITKRRVLSQVYDVMPLFPWYDSSYKYLHVDVPLLEQYQGQLQEFIGGKLQKRLNWLLTGSRAPFGVITEKRVLVVQDCSYQVLPHVLVLQRHLRSLLEEQLTYTQEFNLLRFGKECTAWTTDLAEPTEENLADSWRWVLGMNPAGTCNLLSALRCVFESDAIFVNEEEMEGVGVYFIVCGVPDQDMATLCSYTEQQVSGRGVKVHIVFYNTEPWSRGVVIPSAGRGGRYGGEVETAKGLRQLARAGGGRFHHFRLSGTVESDDSAAVLEELAESELHLKTARDIVENYREFCKRHVPPSPLLEEGCTSPQKQASHPLPTHPRQTTASLARLNACLQKSNTESSAGKLTKKMRSPPKKYIKTKPFYLDEGIRKGLWWDTLECSSSSAKTKNKPLIPEKEEMISSQEWLSKYGLQKLGLRFNQLTPGQSNGRSTPRTVYRHINKTGEAVDLCINHHGLKSYVHKLQTVRNRYHSRLEWLLADGRKQFGTIVERKVVFLVDISSSMTPCFHELRDTLSKLLRQGLPHVKSFNLLAYSSVVTQWREQLVPVSEENCSEAVQWLQSLRPGGCSCLLGALKVAFQSGASGLYLITDGAADHTHEFLLNQLPILRKSCGDLWRINTAAFHCSEEKSHSFLKALAKESGGRYHSYPATVAETKMAEKLSENPHLGDDLKLMVSEILQAQSYLSHSRTLL